MSDDGSHLKIDLVVRGPDMERLAKTERTGPREVVRVLNAVLRKEGSRERIFTKTLMRAHKENDEILPPEDGEYMQMLEDLPEIGSGMEV